MITHLEPDILECEVKWALGSITMNKASEGDRIPVSNPGILFQILKVDWKKSVFIPIPKKGNAKECSSYPTNELISQASKVMLQILQANFQQWVNHGLPDVQAGFRKGRGTRDQIANIRWTIEKVRIPGKKKKTIYFCSVDYAKAFDCVVTINCVKFSNRWEY